MIQRSPQTEAPNLALPWAVHRPSDPSEASDHNHTSNTERPPSTHTAMDMDPQPPTQPTNAPSGSAPRFSPRGNGFTHHNPVHPHRRPSAGPNLFITSPAQRLQAQKKEIKGLPMKKVAENLKICEEVLGDPTAVAKLRDRGTNLRARYSLLKARMTELTMSPTASSSRGFGFGGIELRAPEGAASGGKGGTVGLKQRLMRETVNSRIAMPTTEALQRESDAWQTRQETATHAAFEKLTVSTPQPLPPRIPTGPPEDIGLNFEELDFDEEEDDDDGDDGVGAATDWGEPPDVDKAWAIAEAAGFTRPDNR